jgi:predicted phage-related endonuclease
MVGYTAYAKGYLDYIQHPEVDQLLTQYHFGDSKSEAQHILILDGEERKLYVASLKDTESFISQQWPKIEYDKFDELKVPEEYVPLINAKITQAQKGVKQHNG